MDRGGSCESFIFSWLSLSDYNRVVCINGRCLLTNWNAAVRSYWAGSEPGFFTSPGPFTDPFVAFQLENTVNNVVGNASWMTLN